MKRADLLRLMAILAVVVLASTTTGCLKATIAGKIEPQPLVLSKGDALPGTLTLTMTGWLAGGTFDKLDVEFFDAQSVSLKKLTNLTMNDLILIPVQKTASIELSTIDGLVAPDELWDDDVFVGATATFTVKPNATNYNLTPVVISGVGIIED